MPAPMTSHAAKREMIPEEEPSKARPAANIRLDTGSTRRPPWTSIRRPAAGPSSAETSRPQENAVKIHAVATPSSAAIEFATIAGR
jgi:hypothetical protein